MTAKEAEEYWDFDSPISDISTIECPECEESSALRSWTIGAIYCDLCGEHDAIWCPKCHQPIDSVRTLTFKVVPVRTLNA
jgi:hypothetical protein